MKRTHALVLSLLVALVAAAGMLAASTTVGLGQTATKPRPASTAVIAKQSRALDRWELSLRRSLASKPPKLPRVPRYPHVVIPAVPAMPVAAVVAAAQPVAAPHPATKSKSVTSTPSRHVPRTVRPTSTGSGPDDRGSEPGPTVDSEPPPSPAAPAGASPTVSPSAPPAPSSSPPPTGGDDHHDGFDD